MMHHSSTTGYRGCICIYPLLITLEILSDPVSIRTAAAIKPQCAASEWLFIAQKLVRSIDFAEYEGENIKLFTRPLVAGF